MKLQIAVCAMCGSTQWQHGFVEPEYKRYQMWYRNGFHIHFICLETIVESIRETMKDHEGLAEFTIETLQLEKW